MVEEYWQSVSNGCIENINLIELAEQYGTPLFVYHEAAILKALSYYRTPRYQPIIHYAVKANSNLSILKLIENQGVGFDIVSQGELERVLAIGASPANVIFSGIGKNDTEIIRALTVGVGCLNVESEEELHRINAICHEHQLTAKIAFRVNPDVNPKTHPYISTGMKDNKFGVPINTAKDLYERAKQMPLIELIGVSCHIGSQITDFTSYLEAFDSLLDLVSELEKINIKLQFIDIGGGVGVQTEKDKPVSTANTLIEAIYQKLGDRDYQIHMQPGRSIIANAGYLITGVIGKKHQLDKHFVIVDAAMNDYIRPALYQAYPPITNLSQPSIAHTEIVDIVGPVCESGDFFIKNRPFTAKTGDYLALAGVGAYGMSMSSQYNSRRRAAEILIKEGQAFCIRKREEYRQLWADESIV